GGVGPWARGLGAGGGRVRTPAPRYQAYALAVRHLPRGFVAERMARKRRAPRAQPRTAVD
ncbi:hypothetical protein ACFXA3_37885, partial [Streptomyces sp. NPDC059456]|uniref:hypothetical protein n=1 Tax=Streptomyces sp. NPDC059456 TaxID=3346838 RepID=UPI0036920A56